MKKQDMEKLFLLLEQLFPAAAQRKDKESFVHAWLLLFEDYAYQDVRQAVLEHARESRFFPDPAELFAKMPLNPEMERHREQKKYADMQIPEAAKTALRQLHRRLRHAGLPTAVEAKQQGIPYKEYWRMLEEAGI